MEALEDIIAAITKALAPRTPEYVDIEDVAQEVRIECWRSAPMWNSARGTKLSTFLHLCGFRAGLRWIRSEAHWRGITEGEYRRGAATPAVVSLERDVPKSAGRDGLEGTVVSRVYAAEFMESLTPTQRLICRQRLCGLTSQEMAPLCGIRSDSVRRQLMAIRRRARAWLCSAADERV